MHCASDCSTYPERDSDDDRRHDSRPEVLHRHVRAGTSDGAVRRQRTDRDVEAHQAVPDAENDPQHPGTIEVPAYRQKHIGSVDMLQ